MCTPYQYAALSNPTNIRLIILLPGKGSDTLSCIVQEVSLFSSPPPTYEALSYTWGSGGFSHPIPVYLNSSMKVTSNLHSALLRLRKPEERRTLWVDSMCINQSDNLEKGTQVEMMASIYRQAKEVLIWLGEEDRDTKPAFDCIYSVLRASWDKEFQLTGPDDAQFVALRKLLLRPWFYRCWVFQESTLAQKSTIHCGSYSILSTALAYVCLYFWTPQLRGENRFRYLGNNMYSIVSLLTKNATQQGTLGSTLADLLTSRRGCMSTDRRDVVYSLLGVATCEYSKSIRPDYTREVGELYTSVTRDLLLGDVGLNVWSAINNLILHNVSVPSWVPDWSTQDHAFQSFSSSVNPGLYNAGGDSKLEARPYPPDPKILALKGVHFDTVKLLGAMPDKTNKSKPWAAALDGQWHMLVREEIGMTYFLTGDEPIMLAFLRLCTTDTDPWMDLDSDRARAEVPMDREPDRRKMTREERRWGRRKCHERMMRINQEGLPDMLQELNDYILEQTQYRRLFITEGRQMGLGPMSVAVGDQIWIPFGGEVPILLRMSGRPLLREDGRSMYTKQQNFPGFVGECYIHGIMDGEVVLDRPEEVLIM